MKKFKLLSALLIIAIICLWSCKKDEETKPPLTVTDLDQPITEPTTLLPGIYIVKTVITISSSLTISPGTIIKYEVGTRFDVATAGSINANGTKADPIVFTSIKDDTQGGDTNEDGTTSTPGNNDWRGINDAGTGSVYNYCIFTYGGDGGEAKYTLWIRNTSTITNCTFAHNDGGNLSSQIGDGVLSMRGANVASVIKNNVFYGNNLPMAIDNDMSIDTTNVFQGPAPLLLKNKYNAILTAGTINQAVVWKENEVPFIVTGVLSITTGSSLTLESKVVLKMGASARIDINSGATFNYTNGILTSIKDDSLKGDTNGDGSLTTPAKADWLGVKGGTPFNYIGVESPTGPIRYAAYYAPVIN